jgi:L,D-peptidoglycan transpeptidase YkuD (ErfK/YbiS/YcfS/YnhG family)
MIIVKKTGYIEYKNFEFKCALGKNGIKKKIKEGDNITPKGTFKIKTIYYRKDKVKKILTSIKIEKIKKNMGWCDDPRSAAYNKLINLPNKYSYERLYRKDNIYDLIIVLNYNMRPVIKNKGSAIFIHVANNNYNPTRGCVALSKVDLLKILNNINKRTKVKIG